MKESKKETPETVDAWAAEELAAEAFVLGVMFSLISAGFAGAAGVLLWHAVDWKGGLLGVLAAIAAFVAYACFADMKEWEKQMEKNDE